MDHSGQSPGHQDRSPSFGLFMPQPGEAGYEESQQALRNSRSMSQDIRPLEPNAEELDSDNNEMMPENEPEEPKRSSCANIDEEHVVPEESVADAAEAAAGNDGDEARQATDAGADADADQINEVDDSKVNDSQANTVQSRKTCGNASCERKVRSMEHELTSQDSTIKELREKILKLKREIRDLKKRKDRAQPAASERGSWRERATRDSYDSVWQSMYREENMSINLENMHPDIRLIARPLTDEGDDNNEEAASESASSRAGTFDSDAEAVTGVRRAGTFNSDAEAVTGVRRTGDSFPFDKLPGPLQRKIFKLWLCKEDRLIHCLSRLDPFQPPADFADRLTGRFYYGNKRKISLTHDTKDPNEVLKVFNVCKKWLFMGTHVFYGENTFAFSSFGEFDRFCNGIKAGRVQRIQNVEIFWSGGKCVRFVPNPEEKNTRMNTRIQPLTWFNEMARIRTLVIHIDETSKSVIRRPYEPESLKEYATGKTQGQPEIRISRNLRCCIGMDIIRSLRGLRWIRVYDVSKRPYDGTRDPVRDVSFLKDLEICIMPKVPTRAAKSELQNLERIFDADTGWQPSEVDYKIVQPIYEEDIGHGTRSNQFDHNLGSSHAGSPERNDEEDDDDSDAAPPSGAEPRPNRRARAHTPAASPAREKSVVIDLSDVPDADEESDGNASDGDKKSVVINLSDDSDTDEESDGNASDGDKKSVVINLSDDSDADDDEPDRSEEHGAYDSPPDESDDSQSDDELPNLSRKTVSRQNSVARHTPSRHVSVAYYGLATPSPEGAGVVDRFGGSSRNVSRHSSVMPVAAASDMAAPQRAKSEGASPDHFAPELQRATPVAPPLMNEGDMQPPQDRIISPMPPPGREPTRSESLFVRDNPGEPRFGRSVARSVGHADEREVIDITDEADGPLGALRFQTVPDRMERESPQARKRNREGSSVSEGSSKRRRQSSTPEDMSRDWC